MFCRIADAISPPAESEDKMNFVDRMLYCPKGGQFREFEGVTTHLRPQDLSLYRQLLPPPLTLPKQPIVTLFAADYIRVAPWPLTRYQEWSVLLKCALSGVEGWFSLMMPVTKWLPMIGGRHIGFPKYVADEITVKHQGNAIVARAKHKGIQQLVLEFHPGLTRRLAGWEKELMNDPSFFKEPEGYQLVPPGKGPRVFRIALDHVVKPHWSPCPGMVKVQVDPSENWSALIPARSVFPGTTNHFVGGVNIVPTPV
jgi:hypothetical protein